MVVEMNGTVESSSDGGSVVSNSDGGGDGSITDSVISNRHGKSSNGRSGCTERLVLGIVVRVMKGASEAAGAVEEAAAGTVVLVAVY